MSTIKTIVRGAYDIQKLRIQMGNRIVTNFKAKLGQAPGLPEENMEADEKNVLAELRLHYRKITDGVKQLPRQATFKGDEVISSYTEFCLLTQYLDLETSEARHFRMLESVLKDFPIYTQFLETVRGIGPAMAGVLVSEIDITKATYPSSLWAYAGLDVAKDGKGRSKKAEHLVERQYTNKLGEQATKQSITFNPFLKTKLVGVLAASFLRAGNEKYAKIYNDYKHRLECREDLKETTKGHRHNMALRYMVKMFLVDLYVAWRPIVGLPVAATYQEAKLGHKHTA